MSERLQPFERLRIAGEFRRVFRRGACFRTGPLRIHYLPNRRGHSRVGLVVTRKLGNAVSRNRVKRILREVFRRNKSALPRALDVVLVPRRPPNTHAAYRESFRKWTDLLACGKDVRWSRPGKSRARPGKSRGRPPAERRQAPAAHPPRKPR